MHLVGEDAEGEAEDGVEAELADEDHDGGGGGFGDGVDHPAVQGEDGDLDGEGEEEGKARQSQRATGRPGDGVLLAARCGELRGDQKCRCGL